jgi:hypothetical protein
MSYWDKDVGTTNVTEVVAEVTFDQDPDPTKEKLTMYDATDSQPVSIGELNRIERELLA